MELPVSSILTISAAQIVTRLSIRMQAEAELFLVHNGEENIIYRINYPVAEIFVDYDVITFEGIHGQFASEVYRGTTHAKATEYFISKAIKFLDRR